MAIPFYLNYVELDPNEIILAFEDMMRKKIAMPSQCLRELGGKLNSFSNFSDAATRLGVYTSMDYVNILRELLDDWQIDNVRGLKENGEKARDYLMALPDRLARIAERMKAPTTEYKFGWILG